MMNRKSCQVPLPFLRSVIMADFTSGFWDGFIIVLTVLGIVGCGLLLWSQSTSTVRRTADGKIDPSTGHIWDEIWQN